MKKLVFCALIALTVVPLMAAASPQMETKTCQPRVYEVLRQAAEQLGESYDCLCNSYENGEVTVVKEGDVYRVRVTDSGGNIAILIIDEQL